MAEAKNGVKTLGIKLPDDVHAQLTLIAQLDGMSLTDAIRAAIDGYIERRRQEGDLAGRAASALEEIEREATTRRDALQALFGPQAVTTDTTATEPKTTDRRQRSR